MKQKKDDWESQLQEEAKENKNLTSKREKILSDTKKQLLVQKFEGLVTSQTFDLDKIE